MENEERKKFIESFAVQVNTIATDKFLSETKPTTIGEILDGYREYVQNLGEGFLEIAENYNDCIQMARQSELIGDVKLKARIKDFSSSRINTEKKALDDVFGIEIVTPTELDKEILMLFNHLVFDISKDKKYNKSTGYVAYHCMGDFSRKEETLDIRDWIQKKIASATTREYVRSKSEPTYNNKKCIVPIFPKLQEITGNYDMLNEIADTLKRMLEYMETISPELYLPVVEFQFKTAEVEELALRGPASHTKYKHTKEKMIESKFENGELIRGINSPWKFEGTPRGLELQDFYKTLLENWPFLRKIIVERRNAGKEVKDRDKVSKFDVLTASQFKFLRRYLPKYIYDEDKKEEKWGVLKTAMIVNGLESDQSTSLENELLNQIGNIWEDESMNRENFKGE